MVQQGWLAPQPFSSTANLIWTTHLPCPVISLDLGGPKKTDGSKELPKEGVRHTCGSIPGAYAQASPCRQSRDSRDSHLVLPGRLHMAWRSCGSDPLTSDQDGPNELTGPLFCLPIKRQPNPKRV